MVGVVVSIRHGENDVFSGRSFDKDKRRGGAYLLAEIQ